MGEILAIFVALLVLPSSGLLLPSPTADQVTETKLTLGDIYAIFGLSTSIDGDTAVIGAPSEDFRGAAHVFVRNGASWVQQARLTANDRIEFDFFGVSVSTSGDTVLVGALGGPNRGFIDSAYVFVRSGGVWSQEAKLTASDGAASDFFGVSVSVSGDTAVIGSPRVDAQGGDSGAAYVFVRSGGVWSQEAKLMASDGAAGDLFGESASVGGGTVVISAPHSDAQGGDSGAAYVFVRSGGVWSQEAKLTASDGTTGDWFGRTVSLSGDMVVIGSPLHDALGSDSGAAYVFDRSGGVWSQQAKLMASDGAAGDQFGRAVSINSDTIVSAAPFDDDRGENSGSAYVFRQRQGVWSQEAKLMASDGNAHDRLGGFPTINFASAGEIIGFNPVSTGGGVTVIGAPAHNFPYGAAYVFEFVQAVPLAPRNLEALAGAGRVDLSWEPPLSAGESPITNYQIYRGTTSVDLSPLVELGVVLTYTDTAVTSGVTYYYQVSAVNAKGESPLSNKASATPVIATWANMDPVARPTARGEHAMAYDIESDRIVMFGGWDYVSWTASNETWAYDFNTNTWTNMEPVTRPRARWDHAMAYDSESDQIILLGGQDGGGGMADTWAYDFNTNTWTNMNPVALPPARGELAVAYDAQSDRAIMFGGGPYDDTWAYDFNTNIWTNMNPVARPSVRRGHTMAWDGESDRIILFGGEPFSNETWAYDFDANTWVNMDPVARPSARYYHTMAYHAAVDVVILFGGCAIGGFWSNETWAYDFNTNTWRDTKPTTSPPRLCDHAMAYDSESQRNVVFGAPWNDQTWAYQQTRDATPPTVTITSPADGAILPSKDVTISGTASDNSAVDRVEVSCDDGTTWNVASGTASWTYRCAGLSPGANRVRARAFDSAGWESTHAIVVVNVDLEPPAIDILSPAPGVTTSTTLEIRWVASDLESGVDRVVVQVGTDEPVVFPPTADGYTIVGVGDGTYPITAMAVDRAGNTASDSVVVIVDRTPPDVTITAPASGSYLASSDVVLSWAASDATTTIDHYEVSLDGGAPAVFPATTTTYTFLALPDGSHSFDVTAVDEAGNRQTATAVVVVDTVDPTVFIEYPRPDGVVPSSDARVTWSASDATSGIDRVEVQLSGGSRIVLPGTSRELTLEGLADGGPYQFSVEVFDRVGHAQSDSVTFFVDTNLPSVQIETPVSGSLLNSSAVFLRWLAFDSPAGILRFEIRLDEGALVFLGSEQTSYTFVGVPDGPHTLTVRAFDRVGHAQVAFVSVTIDATPPTLTLASPSAGAVLTSSSVDVVWSTTDAASGLDRIEVALDGGSPERLAAGETRFVLSRLADGPHTVTVKAYDRAGNVETASASFRVDTAIFSPSGPYGIAPLSGVIVVIIAAIVAAASSLVRRRRRRKPPT